MSIYTYSPNLRHLLLYNKLIDYWYILRNVHLNIPTYILICLIIACYLIVVFRSSFDFSQSFISITPVLYVLWSTYLILIVWISDYLGSYNYVPPDFCIYIPTKMNMLRMFKSKVILCNKLCEPCTYKIYVPTYLYTVL